MNTESTEAKQNESGGRAASDNSELLLSRTPCKHPEWERITSGQGCNGQGTCHRERCTQCHILSWKIENTGERRI